MLCLYFCSTGPGPSGRKPSLHAGPAVPSAQSGRAILCSRCSPCPNAPTRQLQAAIALRALSQVMSGGPTSGGALVLLNRPLLSLQHGSPSCASLARSSHRSGCLCPDPESTFSLLLTPGTSTTLAMSLAIREMPPIPSSCDQCHKPLSEPLLCGRCKAFAYCVSCGDFAGDLTSVSGVSLPEAICLVM